MKPETIALILGKPKEPKEVEVEEEESEESGHEYVEEGLQICAKELISSVKSGDSKGVVKALKNAFSLLESAPHAEYPYEEEEE